MLQQTADARSNYQELLDSVLAIEGLDKLPAVRKSLRHFEVMLLLLLLFYGSYYAIAALACVTSDRSCEAFEPGRRSGDSGGKSSPPPSPTCATSGRLKT